MHDLELLRDGFTRVADDLPQLVAGRSAEQLLWQPAPQANHIAWLAWHIGRCEDAQVAALAGVPEVYSDGFCRRFNLPYPETDIGYGQDANQMRAFTLSDPGLLVCYYAAVHGQTLRILDSLDAGDLERILDDPYQVSVGVRLVSVLNDVTQHLGQIAYLRGLLLNR